MQYVNDDMDELFRSAAENYPLDTRGADWSRVLNAMEGRDEQTTVPQKKNKYGRFLWLLLLLPMGIICNRVYTPGVDPGKGFAGRSTGTINTTTRSAVKPGTRKADQKNADVTTVGEESQTVRAAENIPKTAAISQGSTFDNRKQSLKKNVFAGRFNMVRTAPASREYESNVADKGFAHEAVLRTYTRQVSFNRSNRGQPILINRSLVPIINSSGQNRKLKSPERRQKKFYLGLMGGLDATTVKFQKIESAGHDFGLLVGYRINSKWSIEAGSFVEQKFYYSDGKYFNTSKLNLPPTWWIDDVSGNCKMIEVPLSIRYNLAVHKNSTWFSTLGTSSYFMKQEDYVYNYYYGSYGPVAHEKRYDNGSTNLFSSISVSAGYTHQLGGVGDLRIEPYVKLPLSGIGTGKLPLFSTGIHVGVSRKF